MIPVAVIPKIIWLCLYFTIISLSGPQSSCRAENKKYYGIDIYIIFPAFTHGTATYGIKILDIIHKLPLNLRHNYSNVAIHFRTYGAGSFEFGTFMSAYGPYYSYQSLIIPPPWEDGFSHVRIENFWKFNHLLAEMMPWDSEYYRRLRLTRTAEKKRAYKKLYWRRKSKKIIMPLSSGSSRNPHYAIQFNNEDERRYGERYSYFCLNYMASSALSHMDPVEYCKAPKLEPPIYPFNHEIEPDIKLAPEDSLETYDDVIDQLIKNDIDYSPIYDYLMDVTNRDYFRALVRNCEFICPVEWTPSRHKEDLLFISEHALAIGATNLVPYDPETGLSVVESPDRVLNKFYYLRTSFLAKVLRRGIRVPVLAYQFCRGGNYNILNKPAAMPENLFAYMNHLISNYINVDHYHYLPSDAMRKIPTVKHGLVSAKRIIDECSVASDNNFGCLDIVHDPYAGVALDIDRIKDMFLDKKKNDIRYHTTDENYVAYMKTARVAPLNLAPIHRLSRAEEDDYLYMKNYYPVYERYPLFHELHKHTSPRGEAIFAASDALFYARGYGKGLNLHSDDALDRIMEYVTSAYYRLGAYIQLKAESHSEIAKEDTPITPQSGKVQTSGLNYMDPLIVVPYSMMKGTRALFKPKQKNSCPYFGILLGAYFLGNFAELSHSSINSSVYFAPRLLLDGEACRPGTNKPIRTCDTINNDIYHSYSSAVHKKNFLTVLNLEDYRRTDSVYDRFASRHSGLHEHRHWMNLPYLMQPLSELAPYSHSCAAAAPGRSSCSYKYAGSYDLSSRPRPKTRKQLPLDLEGSTKPLDHIPKYLHKYYEVEATPSADRNESIRSWIFGRNYTLDGIYNRRLQRIGNKYYKVVPTEDDDDVIWKVAQMYESYVDEMKRLTGHRRKFIHSANLSKCAIITEDTASMTPLINLIG